jgi:hypothetical protein
MNTNISDMMAELDAIAAQRGIKWGPAEMPGLDHTEQEPLRGNGTAHAASEPITPAQKSLLSWLPQRKGQPALTDEQLKISKNAASAMIDKLSGMKDASRVAPEMDLKTPEFVTEIQRREREDDKRAYVSELMFVDHPDYDRKETAKRYWMPYIQAMMSEGGSALEQWQDWCERMQAQRRKDVDEMLAEDYEAAYAFDRTWRESGANFVKHANSVGESVAAEEYRRNDKTPVKSAGMFRNPFNGEVYKVQRAVHGSGHLYAKKLETLGAPEDGDAEGTFVIAKGAIFKLRESWRMTLAEAELYGLLYGVCCVCGATLTDETSIARGIGPVCAGKVDYWA